MCGFVVSRELCANEFCPAVIQPRGSCTPFRCQVAQDRALDYGGCGRTDMELPGHDIKARHLTCAPCKKAARDESQALYDDIGAIAAESRCEEHEADEERRRRWQSACRSGTPVPAYASRPELASYNPNLPAHDQGSPVLRWDRRMRVAYGQGHEDWVYGDGGQSQDYELECGQEGDEEHVKGGDRA